MNYVIDTWRRNCNLKLQPQWESCSGSEGFIFDNSLCVEPVFLLRPHWSCLVLKGPVGPQGKSSGTAKGPFNMVSTLHVKYRTTPTPLLTYEIRLPCTLHLNASNWNVADWKALKQAQRTCEGEMGHFCRKNSSAGWGHGHLVALEKIGWFGSSAKDAKQSPS